MLNKSEMQINRCFVKFAEIFYNSWLTLRDCGFCFPWERGGGASGGGVI